MKYIHNLTEDLLLDRLIKVVNKQGKKHIIKKNLLELAKNINIDRLNVLLTENIPSIEVKNRRMGSNTYKIPIELKKRRQYFLILRWFKDYILLNTKNNNKKIHMVLLNEINLLSKSQGSIYKKKIELNKIVTDNRIYVNYRW